MPAGPIRSIRSIRLGKSIWPRRANDGGAEPITETITGTIIGDVDGPTAIVGPDGTIGALDGSWRFEWGAGADDRWHIAHDEAAVRQTRIDDTPVFETAMRIPGGDLICRVGSAVDGLDRTLVVEFVNASPSGVALGCVMHVSGTGGRGRTSRLTVDRSEMRLDSGVILAPFRGAGAVTAGAWREIADEPTARSAGVDVDESGGQSGMVFALPHQASLMMVIPGPADPTDPTNPADPAAPTDPITGVASVRPADLASGWRAVTRNAATIEVPDKQLGEAWRRVVPDLVVAAGSADLLVAAEAAPHLDTAGLHGEADRARQALVVAAEDGLLEGPTANAAILALASRELRAGEESGLDLLIGGLIDSAGDALDSASLSAAALALELNLGQDQDRIPASNNSRLAADLRQLAARRNSGSSENRPRQTAGAASADSAGSVGPAGSAGPAGPSSPVARGAVAVLDRLLGPLEDCYVDLLPTVPASWLGQTVDVRGLVTHVGTMSFSLRWHGARPALLWERDGGPETARITCSGLDPTWSSSERQSEALLAAPIAQG